MPWLAPPPKLCSLCNGKVYPVEELYVDTVLYHRNCFRCQVRARASRSRLRLRGCAFRRITRGVAFLAAERHLLTRSRATDVHQGPRPNVTELGATRLLPARATPLRSNAPRASATAAPSRRLAAAPAARQRPAVPPRARSSCLAFVRRH
jgi:hypothetical protein